MLVIHKFTIPLLSCTVVFHACSVAHSC